MNIPDAPLLANILMMMLKAPALSILLKTIIPAILFPAIILDMFGSLPTNFTNWQSSRRLQKNLTFTLLTPQIISLLHAGIPPV